MRIIAGGSCQFVNADAAAVSLPAYLQMPTEDKNFGVAALLLTGIESYAGGATANNGVNTSRGAPSSTATSGLNLTSQDLGNAGGGSRGYMVQQEATLTAMLASFKDGLEGLPADLYAHILADASRLAGIKAETMVYVADALSEPVEDPDDPDGDDAGANVDGTMGEGDGNGEGGTKGSGSQGNLGQPEKKPAEPSMMSWLSNKVFGSSKRASAALLCVTQEAIDALKQCYVVIEQTALDVEGIYRISGSSSQVATFYENHFLNHQNDLEVVKLEDVHTVTSAVK